MKIFRYLLPIILISCTPQHDSGSWGASGSLFNNPINIAPGPVVSPPPPSGGEPTPPIEDNPEATDFKVTSSSGQVTYLNSLVEAVNHAKDPLNYETKVSVKGKDIFALGALVIPFNTQPKKPGDQVDKIPLYDNLDSAYKDYYKESSANAFTTIGPTWQGAHITYAFPIDLVEHHFLDRENSWYKSKSEVKKTYEFKDELFLNIALDGVRNLYMHADFVKELILLKDAADLHHFVKIEEEYTVKDHSKQTYAEMSYRQLWDKDHEITENPTPVPFIKNPAFATFNSDKGVPYDLAPSWMEDEKQYYTFDYHFFYENFEDMGRDIAENGNSRAVNKDAPYINIYNFFNMFKPGAYTVDEIFEYIDYRIEDSQKSKDECEVSLLTNFLPTDWKTDNQGSWPSCKDLIPPFSSQIETFKDMAFTPGGAETGINPAILIAVSEGESSLGRSSASHEDGDPFNFANNYMTVGEIACDFCCNTDRCAKAPSLGVICTECCTACVADLSDQFARTAYIIRSWPVFWQDQVLKGKNNSPTFGFKSGGVAKGYNPSLYWGVHMAAKYYKIDKWHGFCEKKRVYNLSDPISDEILVFLSPTMKNDSGLNTHIKNNSNMTNNPCTKY